MREIRCNWCGDTLQDEYEIFKTKEEFQAAYQASCWTQPAEGLYICGECNQEKQQKQQFKIHSLVGKRVVRTKPATSRGREDWSYTTTPIKILKVSADHIVFQSSFDSKDIRLLDIEWIDDCWTDYDELVEGLD